jgi:hypothetical protein
LKKSSSHFTLSTTLNSYKRFNYPSVAECIENFTSSPDELISEKIFGGCMMGSTLSTTRCLPTIEFNRSVLAFVDKELFVLYQGTLPVSL